MSAGSPGSRRKKRLWPWRTPLSTSASNCPPLWRRTVLLESLLDCSVHLTSFLKKLLEGDKAVKKLLKHEC